jgi:hypothetical protein
MDIVWPRFDDFRKRREDGCVHVHGKLTVDARCASSTHIHHLLKNDLDILGGQRRGGLCAAFERV